MGGRRRLAAQTTELMGWEGTGAKVQRIWWASIFLRFQNRSNCMDYGMVVVRCVWSYSVSILFCYPCGSNDALLDCVSSALCNSKRSQLAYIICSTLETCWWDCLSVYKPRTTQTIMWTTAASREYSAKSTYKHAIEGRVFFTITKNGVSSVSPWPDGRSSSRMSSGYCYTEPNRL